MSGNSNSRPNRRYLLIATAILMGSGGLVAGKAAFGGRKYSLGSERLLNVYLGPAKLNLDPHRMETAISMTILMQLHRGLLRFDSNGDCVPDLAESWEASTDHKTYRFKLREAFFSNGERITSQHVLYSFARVFILQSGIAADIDYISGVRKFVATKKIEDLGIKPVRDDLIEFQLAKPSAIFLKHMAVADLAVMPFRSLHAIEESPKAFSGPYKPVIEIPTGEFSPQVFEVVKWRSDHLQSAYPPEKIRFLHTIENAVDLAERGQNDTLDGISVSREMRALLEARGWGTAPTEITLERFVVLNANKLSPELRRFLCSRLSTKELLKRLDEPNLKEAYGLIPNGFPGELKPSDLPRLDETAEYHGPKVSFQLDFSSDVELDGRVAAYVREAWAHDRIEVVLNPIPKKERISRMVNKQSDAVIGVKAIDYPDGYSVLTYFKGKYDANYYYVDSPVIDAAISATIVEFDLEKRTQAFKDVQREILKFRTVVPLIFGSLASGLWSQKVKNVPSHPMGLHTVAFETIEMQND